MKKSLLLICGGILLLAGCKENNAPINFPKPAPVGIVNLDTSYMLTGPALSSLTTDPHQVLIEEFTGQGCVNCPVGHDDLAAFDLAHPGAVNYVCLFPTGGGGLTAPPTGAANDFESPISKAIGVYVSGGVIGSLPSALIDRVPDASDGIVVSRPNWDADATARLAITDSLNMALSSHYSGDTAYIIVTITYTQQVYSPQNLTLDLLEDSIVDYQSDGRAGAGRDTIDLHYLFTNVFRDMITTNPQGDAILDTVSVKQRGLVYRHEYFYTLPAIAGHPPINPAHCRVVGFVSIPGSGSKYEILQSAQTKLMGP